MKYLFGHLDKFKGQLDNKFVALFLDYDGVLSPIVQRPQDAVIAPATKQLLKQLAKSKDINITIISGRPLEQIKNIVGLEGIVYVGNHGLEIEGPKIKFTARLSAEYKAILKAIENNLNKHAFSIKGVFVEDKGLSLSFHYRMSDKRYIPLARAVFHTDTALYVIRKKIKVTTGKKVLEVRPSLEWDKGRAVLWLLAKQGFAAKKQVLPVYIGDDKTDEDAFKALRNRGLTIFVGRPGHSHAKYYLKNTDDALEFLRYVRINKGKRAV